MVRVSRMHVCFLFHREYPQHYSTAMNEYTTKLVDAGVDVTVIAGRTDPETPRRGTVDGVAVRRIDTDVSTSVSIEPTRFAYRGLRVLDEVCDEREVDVLHMLGFPNLGAVLRPVPWLDSPPVTVMDVRGTAVRNELFDAISRIGLRIQRRLVDHTVVLHRRVAENVFGDTDGLSILPLGADLDRFTPGTCPERRAEWGFEDDHLVVGYTGSIHSPRRLPRLVEAFAAVHETHPHVRLAIVGDGNDRERIAETADSLGVADAVALPGAVPFSEVPDCLRAFDVGFSYIPDRPQYRDQPPLKTVEFLAAGLPVLATDTPGNREFVTDGENGRLVRDDVDAYEHALRSFVEADDDRARLADAARESVRQYDYGRIVEDELLPIYERLVSSHH